MTYQVFARKWRPKSFEALVGQQPMRQALTHALATQKIHHAYLFTGTRGVGKTSLARITAKCLLCVDGITAQACNTCEFCQAIDGGYCLDLIEVDAASRTRVEETRELLDNVQYLPAKARFKIYLIDEVHMLSNHSFNALLKTLEEPPAHVKFLMATTEPEKLPITVLSRCLHFPLKPLRQSEISEHLVHILSRENYPFEASALDMIATTAQGSIRDALSLLEQALAIGQGALKEQDVAAMLGLASHTAAAQVVQAILDYQVPTLLEVTRALAEANVDFVKFLQTVIQLFYEASIQQFNPDKRKADETVQTLTNLQALPPETVQLYYQMAVNGLRDMPWAPSAQAGFEMVMLRLAAFQTMQVLEPKKKLTKIAATEVPLSDSPNPSLRPTPNTIPVPPAAMAKPPLNDVTDGQPSLSAIAPAHSRPRDMPQTAGTWLALIGRLALDPLARQLAKQSVWRVEDSTVLMQLPSDQKPLLNDRIKKSVLGALSEVFGSDITVRIELVEAISGETPAQAEVILNAKAQEMAREAIERDPHIQQLREQLGAQIDSVKPK